MENETLKLIVHHLNFWYGDFQALHKINIAFPEKRITAIIGPSGCGKSTLLRTLNRIFELHRNQRAEGEILLNNEDILSKNYNLDYLRSKIGMVFQKPTPFPMSVYNNIAFGIKLHERLSHAALSERIEWALKQTYLWDEVKDNLSYSAEGLSGGQQQRLCIARAIAIRPEVLLLDEPCSALDPISTQKIEELLLSLQSQYTIITVTHNMQQARRIADYTAFFYLGKLIEFDKTDSLFDNPKNEGTYRYIAGENG